MNRILNEIKAGWNEVRWVWHFSVYLIPTTALAVLLAYVIDGGFSRPPSLMQILLVTLAGLLSLYFVSPDSSTALGFKKRRVAQRLGGKIENKAVALPAVGERLLLLLLTGEEREVVVGDFREEYEQINRKHGKRFADIWFYKQVVQSIQPLLLRNVIKWVGLLGLAELLHKLIGR